MSFITRPETLAAMLKDFDKRISALETYRPSTLNHVANAQWSAYATPTVPHSYTDIANTKTPSFTIKRPTRLLMLAVGSAAITAGSGFAFMQGIIRPPGSGGFTGNTPGSVSNAGTYAPFFMFGGTCFYMPDGVTHPGDQYPAGTYEAVIQLNCDAGITGISVGNLNIDVFSFGE